MHLVGSKGQNLKCSPGRGNLHGCIVMLYVEKGSEREQCRLLCSLLVFSHFPRYPQSNWALLVLIPRWVGFVCSKTLWVSPWTLLWGWEFLPLSPQPPQVFSVRGFEALFPCSGTLGCVVCLAPQLFLPAYPQVNVGLPSPQDGSPSPLAAALPWVLSTGLPISAPPTGLDQCFFFNSLVVRLPYSLVLWQFWWIFVFKLVVSFFWARRRSVSTYTFILARASVLFILNIPLLLFLLLPLPLFLINLTTGFIFSNIQF